MLIVYSTSRTGSFVEHNEIQDIEDHMDSIRTTYEAFIKDTKHDVLEKRGRNKEKLANHAEEFYTFLVEKLRSETETNEDMEQAEADISLLPIMKVCQDMTMVQKEVLYLKLGKLHNQEKKKSAGRGHKKASIVSMSKCERSSVVLDPHTDSRDSQR